MLRHIGLAGTACIAAWSGAGCAKDAPTENVGGVEIEYLAHAAFQIHADDGTRLLIDPFQSRVWLGYDFPRIETPDAVLVSHPHYDHDAGVFRGADWPWPERPPITDPGTYDIGPFAVTAVEGRHAEPYGEEFGRTNTIYVIEAEGVRIVHLGDNGPLTPENIAEIGPVDVLLIPGDALDHILDPVSTTAAIDALAPRVVIPMHYRIPDLESASNSPSDLGEVDGWLERRTRVIRTGVHRTRLSPATLPDRRTVLVLQHSPDVPSPAGRGYAPAGTPVSLAIAGYAKVLCSAVYVSGRDLEEARRHSGLFFLEATQRAGVSAVRHNPDRRAVHVSHGDTVTRSARFHGDQGCVIEPRNGDPGPHFPPTRVTSTVPDPPAWPLLPDTPTPTPDAVQVNAAADAAFAAGALTAAFLAVQRGHVLVERYADGIGPHTQLESWSMGKSLTATLIGILIGEGEIALDDPAPVPAWQEPGDPRAEIRIRDLLQMSGGLRFTAPRDPDYTPALGYPDHMRIYTGAIDAFAFAESRPLQFPPGTEGRYRNSDPLVLGAIIRRTVEGRGENYWTWPQRALFDRLGIQKQVLETDPWGNFLLTGFDYGTARNWARLGQLYLNDGVWDGERILPEGFVDFVREPAPAWSEPVYGGLFWLNRTGEWNLPDDAYFMAGGGGQRVFIVPSLDLIVVRLGHFEGNEVGMAALNEALALLVGALPTPSLADDP